MKTISKEEISIFENLINYLLQHEQEDFYDWCHAQEIDAEKEIKNSESHHIYAIANLAYDSLNKLKGKIE